MQGRFSGRLVTKEEERRLVEECKLAGPLLGGVGKRGDKSRLTLAKVVRGITTGDIRTHCEDRERKLMVRLFFSVQRFREGWHIRTHAVSHTKLHTLQAVAFQCLTCPARTLCSARSIFLNRNKRQFQQPLRMELQHVYDLC